MSETLAVITTARGVVMALAPLLQIRVIVREQEASATSAEDRIAQLNREIERLRILLAAR